NFGGGGEVGAPFGGEHSHRQDGRRHRHRGDPHPARDHPPPHGWVDPGRAGEEQGAERPGDVEEATFDVGAPGGLQQVGDIGAGGDYHPGAQQRPGGGGAPAGEGGGGHDEGKQGQGADRVGGGGRRLQA